MTTAWKGAPGSKAARWPDCLTTARDLPILERIGAMWRAAKVEAALNRSDRRCGSELTRSGGREARPRDGRDAVAESGGLLEGMGGAEDDVVLPAPSAELKADGLARRVVAAG